MDSELIKRIERIEAVLTAQAQYHAALSEFASLPVDEEQEMEPRGFSLKDAALYIGIGKSTLRDRVNRGMMKAPVKVGTKTIYLREDLDAFLNSLSKPFS